MITDAQDANALHDETSNLVVFDNESIPSHRVPSSNSTVQMDSSGTRNLQAPANEAWRNQLLFASGCGTLEEPINYGRRVEIHYRTALDILGRSVNALNLCVQRCSAENNMRAKNMLMEWVVKTGIWKTVPSLFVPDVVYTKSTDERDLWPIVCNGEDEARGVIAKLLAGHAKRSGLSHLTEELLQWVAARESKTKQHLAPTASDFVYVVDPQRMAMTCLAQLLTQLGWSPQPGRLFQLTDRHMLRSLLAITGSNTDTAVHIFESINQLPKLVAKFHQEANADGLESCYKLLVHPNNSGSAPSPTSLLTLSSETLGSSVEQWWESQETVRTLAQVISGSPLPFSSFISAIISDDEAHLETAIEEAVLLYVLLVLFGGVASIDPKRRAFLTNDTVASTSREWCSSVFNGLVQRWLSSMCVDKARLLVIRMGATVLELQLLTNVLAHTMSPPEQAKESGILTGKIIWRALLQAARNENQVPPPSLARYISPELLAECSNTVAPAITAFNFWWCSRFKESAALASFLAPYRVMIAEFGCRASTLQSHFVEEKLGSLFSLQTTRLLDGILLAPSLMVEPVSCGNLLLTTLYFLLGNDRDFLATQLLETSACIAPHLFYSLWTQDRWGNVLKLMLKNHCVSSEESIHVMSVCTLLSSFPAYSALNLLRPYFTIRSDENEEPRRVNLDSKPTRKCIGMNSQNMRNVYSHADSSRCQHLRGNDFLFHSIGGMLNEYVEPGKLLSLHSARELMKKITSQPEMSSCRLKLEAALTAVYESGKKQLNALGMALADSVRLLLNDQAVASRELEKRCQQVLGQCIEAACKSRLRTHDVCLSSTVCDICGDLLTLHGTAGEIHDLEKIALQGKVCAMSTCAHRFHALCLRSLVIAVNPKSM